MKNSNEHEVCLLCNSKEFIELEEFSKDYLVKCKNCDFVFSKRIPTEKEISDVYENYGRDDYLSPVTIKRYNSLLDEFEKYRKTNKIIDVGAGIGYFLNEAKKRGWEVYGTEMTDAAIEICTKKGINMKQGVLNPDDYPAESFDVVTSFEVLEHINNPTTEIGSFYKILRKGGLVYLTTPNFNSLLRYRLKGDYDIIVYPEHLSYYTSKTLKRLFVQSGFKKEKIETTGISMTRIKRAKAHKENQKLEELVSEESSDEKIRSKIEERKILLIVKSCINHFLTLFGVGDTLKGWFTKV